MFSEANNHEKHQQTKQTRTILKKKMNSMNQTKEKYIIPIVVLGWTELEFNEMFSEANNHKKHQMKQTRTIFKKKMNSTNQTKEKFIIPIVVLGWT